MGSAVDVLLELLDLEQPEPLTFVSRAVDTQHERLYGGQLVAQALMAAGRTVDPARAVHSLHAYFVKGGAGADPVRFEVEAVRDSATFNTRRVVASQADRTLLSLEASFQVPEPGFEDDVVALSGPGPDEMVETDDWRLAVDPDDPLAVEPYYVDAVEFRQSEATLGGPDKAWPRGLRQPWRDVWLRARGALPDQPLVHACVLAYASDKPLLGTTVLSPPVHGDSRNRLIASLDHSMWFHRPFRADDWLRAHFTSTSTGGGRAYARGEFARADGATAISATQEGLLRTLT